MRRQERHYDRDLVSMLSADSFYQDPYPVLARLRDESPVHWVESAGEWLVSRYDEVQHVFKSPAIFSNYGFQNNYFERLRPELRTLVPTLEARGAAPNLITSDPPDHTTLRRAVQAAFNRRAVHAMRTRIAETVDEYLQQVDGTREIEFVTLLAYPLPATVLADILGAPRTDRELFREWSTELLGFMSKADPNREITPQVAARADASLRECYAYLTQLIEDRRRRPQADVTTAFATFGAPDDVLRMADLLSNLVLFLTAGHETTTGLLSSGLYALLSHPAQLATVRADRSKLPEAVDEMLRWETPVQRLRRTARQDVELAGVLIRAGDAVEVLTGAANRDQTRFADPDRFNVDRADNAHLSFGHGIHFCIGALLARLEAEVTFNAILDRYASMRLPDGWTPEWRQSTVLRQLTSLPVEVEFA